MNNRVTIRAIGLFTSACFIVLVALILRSPTRSLYDEWFVVEYIRLFHQSSGFTAFLTSLVGAVGPLCAFVQIAFEPVTRLSPVNLRLVNAFMLLIVGSILAAWRARQDRGDYWVVGCSVMVVPMTWVVAGLALSEMSAMVFLTASLYLQLRGLESLQNRIPVTPWFLAAGVCLGIATWGRQPSLLIVGVPILLAFREPKLRLPAIAFIGTAIGLALPLFIVWKGFVPPSNHFVEGLSPIHGVISYGYIGICALLLAPRFRSRQKKRFLILALLTVLGNGLLRAYSLYPLQSVVTHLLSARDLAVYGNLCGSMFLSCGMISLTFFISLLWEERNDPSRSALNAGLLLLAASPALVGHQYSSRYTAIALPYMILVVQPWRTWGPLTAITSVVGCSAGLVSLLGYFSQP